MTELEQYLAMIKRVGYKYETITRDDGSVLIIIDGDGVTCHRFSSIGRFLDCSGSE